MLKRRQKGDFLTYALNNVRLFFWPRGGWIGAWRYLIWRMKRMRATPHALTLGFAVGTFVSFTPFIGFHFLLAALIAWILRGNIIASALGTSVGNPLTFPFIWAGDYVVGIFLLSGNWMSWNDVAVPTNLDEAAEAFYPLLVGSLPLGLIGAVMCYVPVFFLIRAYRARKDTRKDKLRESRHNKQSGHYD